MIDKLILQPVADILYKKNFTVAVAESVTAGLLQTTFAAAENATAFFQGGFTTYNARQKYTHLQIDLTEAIKCNCVSEVIASQMAIGASKIFQTDLGIGITGYASPLPGHQMDTLYAFYAISWRNEVIKSGKITSDKKEPLQMQLKYIEFILKSLLEELILIEQKVV